MILLIKNKVTMYPINFSCILIISDTVRLIKFNDALLYSIYLNKFFKQ